MHRFLYLCYSVRPKLLSPSSPSPFKAQFTAQSSTKPLPPPFLSCRPPILACRSPLVFNNTVPCTEGNWTYICLHDHTVKTGAASLKILSPAAVFTAGTDIEQFNQFLFVSDQVKIPHIWLRPALYDSHIQTFSWIQHLLYPKTS